MKKLLYSVLALAVTGTVFTGCGNKDDDGNGDSAPKGPSIEFQTNTGTFGGYTFADDKKQIGSVIKIGVKINSEVNLKSTKMTVKYNNQPEILISTDSVFSSNTKTCNRDYVFTLPMDKGTYTFTAYATDKDATTSTAKIVITAFGPLTDRGVGMVYSLKATTPGNFSAFDLFEGEAITAASGAGNEAQRDIVDQSTGDVLSGIWKSQNGTEFLISDNQGRLNNKVYSQFLSEQDVIDAWNAGGNKSTQISNVEANRLIIARSVRGGVTYYYLIAISDVVDDTGADNDYYEFQYKQ